MTTQNKNKKIKELEDRIAQLERNSINKNLIVRIAYPEPQKIFEERCRYCGRPKKDCRGHIIG